MVIMGNALPQRAQRTRRNTPGVRLPFGGRESTGQAVFSASEIRSPAKPLVNKYRFTFCSRSHSFRPLVLGRSFSTAMARC